MPKKLTFASPQAAEEAFYAAFQRNDLETMLEVWAPGDTVACVHPGGERLMGFASIAKSWRQIFDSGSTLEFEVVLDQYAHGPQLAVHSVRERIVVDGRLRGVVLATNVYELQGESWRMILHHASPAPPDADGASASRPSRIH